MSTPRRMEEKLTDRGLVAIAWSATTGERGVKRNNNNKKFKLETRRCINIMIFLFLFLVFYT